MKEQEILKIANECGIIPWTKHDFLVDVKKFRDLPIDEGMDGDRECLLQFAKLIAKIERERCAAEVEKAGEQGYGTLAAAAMIRLLDS